MDFRSVAQIVLPIFLAINSFILFISARSDLKGLILPFNQSWNEEDAVKFGNAIFVEDNLLSPEEHDKLITHADELLFAKVPSKNRQGVYQPVGQFLYCGVHGVTPKSKALWANNSINDPETSQYFQLLPSDIKVDLDGKVTILSYINNLDPSAYRKLYKDIEILLERTVPLFQQVLENLIPDDFLKRKIDLRGNMIQVIIGLRGTYINPENPSFPGGVWHSEGMKNERIIASSVYYYEVENVRDSFLGFRLQLEGLLKFKEVLKVSSKRNRFVVFPNTLQHNVLPFTLFNESRPGRRMAITISLVDPEERILSTGDTPPQQEDWYPIYDENIIPLSPLFPKCEEEECPTMSLQEAFQYRELALEERKVRNQCKKDGEIDAVKSFNFPLDHCLLMK